MLDRAVGESGFSDKARGVTLMTYYETASTNRAAQGELPSVVTRERMEGALLRLPRFTRKVFLAHRVDDLSYSEIAARTGVSVQRVEREIARALVGLDRALTESPRTGWWRRWAN